MASKAAHKRLTKEYKAITANPTPYITAHPSESNILEWHYILTGPPATPYEGGQYWGTLVFPADYPFAPPSVRVHTPSGRFKCSERLCLSISDFHPKSWNPAWEVSTILLGVLSFMTGEEITTGSLKASDVQRRALAVRTRWWNSTGGGSTTRRLEGQEKLAQSSMEALTGVKGFGAIKAGDGGKKFRDEWPEEDEANWKWMERERIDPQSGKFLVSQQTQQSCSPETDALRRRVSTSTTAGLQGMVEGGREVGAVGQGWVRRHTWALVVGALIAYVLFSRAMGAS